MEVGKVGIVPLNRVATNLDKTSMQLRKAT